ncbi:hypothetical protein B0T26DRAFT_672253 [Lasiosphaeria miniovina]|uniref:Uncharacterized protein n=1 Tax=Lasiosphaeria miniovina TaxID=1954250 RepID=A0AA40E4B9_9PEZI|nr:uncharacterized protein B0T26DRAFT_672253 [Lasiosphaeria miniovina]KAK0727609.1 hypothetical protein B0T26DRAFT_672253 [Lasiosphaeria miniovina]
MKAVLAIGTSPSILGSLFSHLAAVTGSNETRSFDERKSSVSWGGGGIDIDNDYLANLRLCGNSLQNSHRPRLVAWWTELVGTRWVPPPGLVLGLIIWECEEALVRTNQGQQL